jgi:flagellar basal body-associated protein FliL
LSKGGIAGIVVAVLLVVLVAVGIGIYWMQKRKRDPYGPKQFNNPILYSTANTDEFDVE